MGCWEGREPGGEGWKGGLLSAESLYMKRVIFKLMSSGACQSSPGRFI